MKSFGYKESVKRIEQLQSQLAELDQKKRELDHVIMNQDQEISELRSALEFYGSTSLNQDNAWVFRKKFMFDLVNESDLEELQEPVGNNGRKYVIGGKRARQALQNTKKELGE